jgi:hypothetical protein
MNTKKILSTIIIIVFLLTLGYYFNNTRESTKKTESPTTQKTENREAKNAGWKVYTNPKYGYEFEYPGNAQIEVSNPDTNYEFTNIKGPAPTDGNDGRNYPWITIQHYPDAEFFNPPTSATIDDWVLNNSKFPQEYDKVQKGVSIGGEPAVDLIFNGSMQADATDDYYLIHKGKLYQIQLLHVRNTKDWQLYDTFLKSFKFVN